ncbi:hypothetical protein Bca4012_053290 [Brassica carinata]|uniref:Uncharacterized protein n=1 Tax=Brassica carinata TaxID=52824 RepID=A0A8X7R8D1_BRACI|nr:hypothetical protein Bca52824_055838 [Brassica carinata]
MVKTEEELDRTNPDYHHPEDSMINSFDIFFSQLLLDPYFHLESGGGEGDFALMSSSTNSPLPNTSGDHHQQEIFQWFGSSNFQKEAINDVFLNNNYNIANLETNENTKLYGN